VVTSLEKALSGSEASLQALAEMRELAEGLAALNVSEAHAKFDTSLARGLDYYTGPVFETVLPNAPEFGSVMGGGRYDQLVERFTDRSIPCTGMAVGLDRLLAALRHLGVGAAPAKTVVQALVVTMGAVPKGETLKVAAELRAAGIRTETYFGKKMNMKSQLSHADHYEIPVAVIIGEDEIAKGVVSVKDLRAGKQAREAIQDHDAYRKAGTSTQVTVPRAELVQAVKEFLANHSL
jgi:histidyl-tRNA synthetase